MNKILLISLVIAGLLLVGGLFLMSQNQMSVTITDTPTQIIERSLTP